MKYQLDVSITNINVENTYYSFDYTVMIVGKNYKKSIEGAIGDDTEGWTDKAWKKELEDGEALKLALEEIGTDF